MTEIPSLAVSKRLETDEFAYPSVRLRVSTDAGEPVAVRLVESLPPGVDETAVGFHEDEGYEHWSVTGEDRIVYEDVVRESEPASTLYAIVDATPDQLAACLDTPSVEIARADDHDAVDAADWTPLDDERIDASIGDVGGDARPSDRQTSPEGGDWGGSGTTMNQDEEQTTDEQSGKSTEWNEQNGSATGSGEGHDDPSPTADGDEAEALTRGGVSADRDATALTEPATEPDTTAPGGMAGLDSDGTDETASSDGVASDETTGSDEASSGGSADSGGATSGEPAHRNVPTQPEPHDSVVEQFAAELRRDEPSSQAVATLRSHLRPDTAGSAEAKLDHCMARIGELDAYVDALEAFLDEEGTAEQLLAEVRDDLRAVEAHVEDVERRVDSVETAQARLDDRLASVESDLESVEDLDATVTETRAELTDAVADVEEEVAALGEDLESVEEWRSTVVQALSAAQDASAAAESDAD